jgi:plasmid stabilization system protein ParE
LKVYLSPLAEFKLELLYQYLEVEWSVRIKRDFQQKLFTSFKRISQFPKSCPESSSYPGIFKCTFTKHNSYTYRVLHQEIEIITVFDNRQDPIKIQKEINDHFA